MSTTAMIRPEGRVTVPSPTGARRGDMFTPRMIHHVTWTRFIYYYFWMRVVFDVAFIWGSVHIPPPFSLLLHARFAMGVRCVRSVSGCFCGALRVVM